MWDYEVSSDGQHIVRSITACNVWKIEEGTIQKQNVELLGEFVQYDGTTFMTGVTFREEPTPYLHTYGYMPNRHYNGGLDVGDFLQMDEGLAVTSTVPFEGLCVIFKHTNHPYIGYGVLPLTDIHYTDETLETIQSIVGHDSQWTHRELQDEIRRYMLL